MQLSAMTGPALTLGSPDNGMGPASGKGPFKKWNYILRKYIYTAKNIDDSKEHRW